jgi:hypothetical protein
LGADDVTLDTLISFCGFHIDEPRRIDLGAFDDAAADAGYGLRELTLSVPGRPERGPCDRCEDEVWWLALEGVDQRLELTAEPEAKSVGRFTLEVEGWGSEHPRSTVTAWEPDPPLTRAEAP